MPLSRSEVLGGAVRLLDEVGLDALTMRRLADSLGVQAGAIYWHFANKQELVDAMVEAGLSDVLEAPLTGSWEAKLVELSRRMARSLARRRDGARLATLAVKPGPNGLRVSETMLKIVRDAGFSKELALWGTSVLGYFLLGYVTDLQALESARRRGLDGVLETFKAELDPKQFPQLHELTDDNLEELMSRRAFEERFEFGLTVILTGLKAAKRTAGKPARRVTKKKRS